MLVRNVNISCLPSRSRSMMNKYYSSIRQQPTQEDETTGRDVINFPDSKVHGANMGPIWGRQGPGGPHVGSMNFAIWVIPLGRCGNKFKSFTFKLITQNSNFSSHCEIAVSWMTQNFTNEKSTLVQVMAWGCQATSHYLSKYWPQSMSSYGVTRPQWVHSHYLLLGDGVVLITVYSSNKVKGLLY